MDESKSGQTQHTQLLCWCCCCLLLQYKLRHHRQNVAIGRRKGWPRRRLDSRKIGNCLQTMSHSHTLSLSISRSLCMSNVSHRHSRVCLSTCGSMCSHVYRFLVIYLFFCSFSSFIEWLSSFSSVLCCCYYHYSIRFTRYGFMPWWSFFFPKCFSFHVQQQSVAEAHTKSKLYVCAENLPTTTTTMTAAGERPEETATSERNFPATEKFVRDRQMWKWMLSLVPFAMPFLIFCCCIVVRVVIVCARAAAGAVAVTTLR